MESIRSFSRSNQSFNRKTDDRIPYPAFKGMGWGNWVGLHGQWEAGYGYLVRIRLDHHVWMGGGGRPRVYRIFFYIFGYTMLSFTLRKCEMFKNCQDVFAIIACKLDKNKVICENRSKHVLLPTLVRTSLSTQTIRPTYHQ